MFDVKGSLTISSVKTSSSFASSAERAINTAINAATKPVKLKIETDTSQLKSTVSQVKTLSDKAINPLVEATKKAEVATKNLNEQINNTKNASKNANKDLKNTDNIFEKLSRQASNMLTFTIVAGVFFQLTKAVNSTISSIIRFEKDIINVTKVMNVSDSEISKLEDTVKDLGITFGFSLSEATNAAAVYAQQGKSMNEVIRLTEASLLLANISILTTTESTEALTAIINQFGFSSNEVVKVIDSLNEVANKFAVTEADITEAIKRSGAAAEEAGVSFEKFSGFVAALQERTRRGGRVIGTALKTIFARLNTEKAVKALREVGVGSFDLEGNFTNLSDRLDQVALTWENLSNVQRVNIATAVAGKRRYSDFISLMSGYDTVLAATNTALNAQGSAMTENEKIMGTLDKTIKSLKTTWDSFAVSLGDAKINSTIGLVAKSFQGIAYALSSIPPEIITALLSGAAISGISKLGGGILGQLKDFKTSKIGGDEQAKKKESIATKSLTKNINDAGSALKSFSKQAYALGKYSIQKQGIGGTAKNVGGFFGRAVGGVLGSSAGLLTAGAATDFASRKLEERGVKGTDALSSIGTGFNIAAISQMSGAAGKIAEKLGISAGHLNIMTVLAATIVGSFVSIYNTWQEYTHLSIKTTKELQKFRNVQKEVKQGLFDIQKINEKAFSVENIDKQIAAFEKLVEKSPMLGQFSDEFSKAVSSGEKFEEVLRKILARSKEIEDEKSRNLAQQKINELKLDPRFKFDSRYFNKDIPKEELQNAVSSVSASVNDYIKEISSIEIKPETTRKDIAKVADSASSKAIDDVGTKGLNFQAADAIIEGRVKAIDRAFNRKLEELKRFLPKEEEARIEEAVSGYNKEILSVEVAINNSKKVHENYSKFINDTAEIIGNVDVSTGIAISYKRLKEAQDNISRLNIAGVIDQNILEPFVNELDTFNKRGESLINSFSGESAKSLVDAFAESGKSAESPFGQVVGTIIKNALGGNVELNKIGKDKAYTKNIQDAVKNIFGKAFSGEELRKIIGSANISFANVGAEGIAGILKGLKQKLEDSKNREKELLAVRELSVEISKSIIETQQEINKSYENLIVASKNIVKVNNDIASVRNRVIDIESKGIDEYIIASKKAQAAKSLETKNLELINDAQERARIQSAINIENIEKRMADGSEARKKAVLEAQSVIRSKENEFNQERISAIDKTREALSNQISAIDSEIKNIRSQAKVRTLTTVEDRIQQERSYDFALAAAGTQDFKTGDVLSKEQVVSFKQATVSNRDVIFKDLEALISQGGTIGKNAEDFINQILGIDTKALEKQREEVEKKRLDANKKIEEIYNKINKNFSDNLRLESTNIKNFGDILNSQKSFFNEAVSLLNSDKNNSKNSDTIAGGDSLANRSIRNDKIQKDISSLFEISEESADKIGQAFAKHIKKDGIKSNIEVSSSVKIVGDGVKDAVAMTVQEKIDENREAINKTIKDSIREGYDKNKILGRN